MAQMQFFFLSDGASVPDNPPPGGGPRHPETLASIKERLEKGLSHCKEVGFNGTAKAIRLLIHEIDTFHPSLSNFGDTMNFRFEEAMRRLKEDCEAFLFLEIDPAKRTYFANADAPFGPDVALAFPDAASHNHEASRCYALESADASVYHSMMTLEYGLYALARKLKVPVKKDRSTWGPLIESIKTKIETELKAYLNKLSAKTATQADHKHKAYLTECHEAATEFRYFKDTWRDHIAHNRADYDHTDALKALEHVNSFMAILVRKLKLKQVKIT